MAAKQLPEYQQWENLVDKHWDHWQYYLNLYSFALQKPARSIFTSFLYPGFYQERLLNRDFAAAMQLVGEVTESEISEYRGLIRDVAIGRTYRYHQSGPMRSSIYWTPIGAMVSLTATIIAARIRKPKVWYFVPAAMLYVASIGLENRFHMLRLGKVVDMAHWAAEKRKANVWMAEKKQEVANLPSVYSLEAQLIELVRGFNA